MSGSTAGSDRPNPGTDDLSLAVSASSGSVDHVRKMRAADTPATSPTGSVASTSSLHSTTGGPPNSDPPHSWGIALPDVSHRDVQQAIATLNTLWDRTLQQDDLASQHHTLQQSFREQKERGDRLEAELARLFDLAGSLASTAQHRYAVLLHRYRGISLAHAEYATELTLRKDQANKVIRLQELLRLEREVRKDDLKGYQIDLESAACSLVEESNRAAAEIKEI